MTTISETAPTRARRRPAARIWHRATHALPALGCSLHRDRAGVHDTKISPGRDFDEPAGAKQCGKLVAFVLVDPAAEGLDGEGLKHGTLGRGFTSNYYSVPLKWHCRLDSP